MPGLSFDVLRVGKKYSMVNFNEKYEFIIEEIFPGPDFRLKDIHTLEIMFMRDLLRLGKGKDFEIRELAE